MYFQVEASVSSSLHLYTSSLLDFDISQNPPVPAGSTRHEQRTKDLLELGNLKSEMPSEEEEEEEAVACRQQEEDGSALSLVAGM